MPRPTFLDKVDRIVSSYSRIYKVIADDMNQLKNGIIGLYNMFTSARTPSIIQISPSDFSGPNYNNSNLVNLNPDTDFALFSDEGSGTLLREGIYPEDGYTFNAALGRITVNEPGYYRLFINAKITEQ